MHCTGPVVIRVLVDAPADTGALEHVGYRRPSQRGAAYVGAQPRLEQGVRRLVAFDPTLLLSIKRTRARSKHILWGHRDVSSPTQLIMRNSHADAARELRAAGSNRNSLKYSNTLFVLWNGSVRCDPMPKPPNNLHDAFFKNFMSEPALAGRFLQEHLPSEVGYFDDIEIIWAVSFFWLRYIDELGF